MILPIFSLFILYHGAITVEATPWAANPANGLRSMPRPTPGPDATITAKALAQRQLLLDVSTCGYSGGDPNMPITATKGTVCRADLDMGFWGLCSEDIKEVSGCSFAGYCYDTYTCQRGCGRTESGTSFISTTCTQARQYCSTAVLIVAGDMSFTEIGCGPVAKTETYLGGPTESGAETTATPTTSSSKPSTVPASQTSSAATATPTGDKCKDGEARCGQGCMPAGSVCCDNNTFCSSDSICVSGGCSSNSTTTVTNTPSTTTPLPSASASSTSNRSGGSSLNISAIVTGTLGGLALICITVIIVICIVRNQRKEKPARQKRSFLVLPRKKSKNSDSSSRTASTLGETQYPEPPDNKAHPEAGWGPSEAYGSEVAPHRGPWEMLNEERSHEMSDHNRPVELPDYTFLETLPTIPQAPTRQDSWRPNDDGAAWGDLRAPPRIRDRLRYASPRTAAGDGQSGNVASANFAAPGWGHRDEHAGAPVPDGQSAAIRRQKTAVGLKEMAPGPATSDDGTRQVQHRGGIPSATASVSSHGSLYTSSPTKF